MQSLVYLLLLLTELLTWTELLTQGGPKVSYSQSVSNSVSNYGAKFRVYG